VSLRNVGRVAVVAVASIGLALGASGCLSDDTSVPVPPAKDAASEDAGFPVSDASGSVDGANPPPADAGTDAPVVDSSVPIDATPPVDAGRDAFAPSQLGLVAGGTVSQSPSYTMTGTTAPATAPVLRSPNYKIVGGMAVTTQQP
jgi:hypothetical protein